MKKSQESGDNSINLQAENITLTQTGPSYLEVRQIALDVFRSNFFELAGEAKETARKRAEELTDDFLQKLAKEHADGLSQANSPDFQHALFTAQREYARCGDAELGGLLVDLLIDRTKHPDRSILQIVLNESLVVAPKLTSEQLGVLSLVFISRYTINNGILSYSAFEDYLRDYFLPFADFITDKQTCFQHLEYSGCGTVGLNTVQLEEVFRQNYSGLFSNGFTADEFTAMGFSFPISHPLIIPCLGVHEKFQIASMNLNVMKEQCKKLELGDDDTNKLTNLFNSHFMGQHEARQKVTELAPFMENMFKTWSASNISHFTLTSVGIAIGHANVKKHRGEFTDLAIWIN